MPSCGARQGQWASWRPGHFWPSPLRPPQTETARLHINDAPLTSTKLLESKSDNFSFQPTLMMGSSSYGQGKLSVELSCSMAPSNPKTTDGARARILVASHLAANIMKPKLGFGNPLLRKTVPIAYQSVPPFLLLHPVCSAYLEIQWLVGA